MFFNRKYIIYLLIFKVSYMFWKKVFFVYSFLLLLSAATLNCSVIVVVVVVFCFLTLFFVSAFFHFVVPSSAMHLRVYACLRQAKKVFQFQFCSLFRSLCFFYCSVSLSTHNKIKIMCINSCKNKKSGEKMKTQKSS